jgi:hypothetical protein
MQIESDAEDEDNNESEKEDIEDHESEEWETEDDSNDDGFEEEIVDVSDNEILYDKDGNIIIEEELGEGLKEIMEYHMGRLQKRLDIFAVLASTEEGDEEDEEEKGNNMNL